MLSVSWRKDGSNMANAILFAILFVLSIGGMLLVITWALNSLR